MVPGGRQFIRPRRKDAKDHTIAVFMLRGQVRAAVRFITDRVSRGGILSSDFLSNVPSLTVFDVLAKKHPEPSEVVPSTFLPCDTLPPLSDLDITGRHVEKITRRLQGASGPGGSSATQWRDDMAVAMPNYVILWQCMLITWLMALWSGMKFRHWWLIVLLLWTSFQVFAQLALGKPCRGF